MNSKITGALVATAVAGLFIAGAAKAADEAPATGAKVKCEGINSCKGHGSCKGAGHGCAGQNGCAGKGWVETTKEECAAKNGKVVTN